MLTHLVFIQTLAMPELRVKHNRRLMRKASIERIENPHGGTLEEDRRLPMFGWTVEALNMLVLPMIRDQ